MYFPERSTQFTGTDIAAMLLTLEPPAREAFIFEQVKNGCVPDFMRAPALIHLSGPGTQGHIDVCPDYLCLGTDDDFVYTPCSIVTAQKIADEIGAMLPTKKLVDEIWKQAPVKLEPHTQTPDKKMVTAPVIVKQGREVAAIRRARSESLGVLTAGAFKDYILVPVLADRRDRTCIYGWHRKDGRVIQDANASAHDRNYVDYSQCPRFISQDMAVGDDFLLTSEVLAHPLLHILVTSEGSSRVARVPGV